MLCIVICVSLLLKCLECDVYSQSVVAGEGIVALVVHAQSAVHVVAVDNGCEAAITCERGKVIDCHREAQAAYYLALYWHVPT